MSAETESRMNADFQDGEALANGNVPLFNMDSSENRPHKEGRVIKKAKRTVKQSPKKDEDNQNGVTMTPSIANHGKKPVPYSKNSRKSRNSRGRGLPKGGAGGKGTWGKPGSEGFGPSTVEDSRDPNYDSDSQGDYVVKVVKPELKDDEFQKAIEPIFQEYLEHGDSEEVIDLLERLNMGRLRYKIPALAVSLAMERHDPHREMTSRLISDLSGHVLSQAEFTMGFDQLLNNLEDLTLDTPDAPTILGQFIARAVADECLAKDFTTTYKGKVDCELVRVSLEKAEVLLTLNKNIVQLDNIWGVGGGSRPVKYLVNKIIDLLKEYLSSGDITEAARCLKELDVPHFHHELVYQAAVIAIEDSSERATDKMVSLLKIFTGTCVVTPDEFNKGVKRVFEDMPDICLDVPNAYALLERIGNKMEAEGILSDDLAKDMPNRGRKRFVSEGDGGKLKEQQNGVH